MGSMAGEAARRCATSALSTNGGFNVTLRLPGMAVSGSDAEQLGLATPQFADVPLGPAVWRRAGAATELLLDGEAVGLLAGTQGVADGTALLQMAVGVVIEGALYVIVRSEPLVVCGVPCAYRLVLEPPTWA